MNKMLLLFVLLANAAFAQINAELTPGGFRPMTFDRPTKSDEKLIEAVKNWAIYYNRNSDYSYDVYDVTATSASVDGFRNNALFYRNRGEIYRHRIRYTLHVDLAQDTYTVTFSVKEIYSNNTLTELTVSDFFAPDGRLKEDYEEVKPSLQKTAENVIRSFVSYLERG